ncbi:MAG: SagB family peptide dehydrogenase [Deltaproteobacteria bacterium]|nr:SagB family peptide dehydrogenase [Deltaproteobacteria bacterium]
MVTTDPIVLSILSAFSTPKKISDVVQQFPELDQEDFENVVEQLLDIGALLTPATLNGQAPELWWEVHDYWHMLHTATARGGVGRLTNQKSVSAPPAVRPGWENASVIELPRQLAELAPASLDQLLDLRQTVRRYAKRPLALAELSRLLWSGMRNTQSPRENTTLQMEIIRRPYPSGGSTYSLELYIIVPPDGLETVEPGVYHYCPARHLLERLESIEQHVSQIRRNALGAAGVERQDGGQPLIFALTSRVGRVSYKYEGNAHALIAREVGCVYQTLYLLCANMDLAPCALGLSGLGSSELAEIGGFDPHLETVVGYMLVGAKQI